MSHRSKSQGCGEEARLLPGEDSDTDATANRLHISNVTPSPASSSERDINKHLIHNNNKNRDSNNYRKKIRGLLGMGRRVSYASCRLSLGMKGKSDPPMRSAWSSTTWPPRCAIRRKHFVGIVALALVVLYINYEIVGDDGEDGGEDRVPVIHYSHVPGMKDYLVWSDHCKMPNMDPYLPDVMKVFKRQKYKACSGSPPLTSTVFNATTQLYTLQVNTASISAYSKAGLTNCCYRRIERPGRGQKADTEIRLADCVFFKHSVVLPPTVDNLLVSCFYRRKRIYQHGHALMPARPEILDRLAKWAPTKKQQHLAPNVMMIGIDSISRNNLIRAMPHTAQYLYDNEWFEMSGYNKIDDNTFPNLMAVLTGLTMGEARRLCPATRVNGLANCTFLWDMFRQHGYVTAYAEDEADINTFNFLKLGFETPPVDYYMRPFLLAADAHFPAQMKSTLKFCLGLLHSADYVYDYALELARRFPRDPFFGLFWTNSFSHNSLSDPSSMDDRMLGYLQQLSVLGTLNNTVVVFFSDHGMRFGPSCNTLSGHFEERLPFMFLWLPPTLKAAYPEFVNALSTNKNRLTNPYDIHMTLKAVLQLSGRVNGTESLIAAPAQGCERCQSLLRPVPHNRSCSEIAIEDHWCTCIPYQSVYKNSKKALKLAQRVVAHINDFVATYRNGSYAAKCAKLKLHSTDSVYKAKTESAGGAGSPETYRIVLYTAPNKGLFEATVQYTEATDAFVVTGNISRLNKYSAESHCVEDGAAKKYCSCHSGTESFYQRAFARLRQLRQHRIIRQALEEIL